eukprot:scaffold605147_cov14-Prasinocladus_malaysianus.AAC.1
MRGGASCDQARIMFRRCAQARDFSYRTVAHGAYLLGWAVRLFALRSSIRAGGPRTVRCPAR